MAGAGGEQAEQEASLPGLGPSPGSHRVQGAPCGLYVFTCVGVCGCMWTRGALQGQVGLGGLANYTLKGSFGVTHSGCFPPAGVCSPDSH